MRKGILKKVVATLGTVAMAVGMLVSPKASMKVEAAESKLYVHDKESWKWVAELTSTDDNVYEGEMTIGAAMNVSVATSNNSNGDPVTSECLEINSVTTNLPEYSIWTSDESWNLGQQYAWLKAPDSEGIYTVTYTKSTGALTVNLKSVSTVVYTYEYYVAGATAFEAEDWSKNESAQYGTKAKMTASGTNYTYTYTTTAAFSGSQGYNIIEIATGDDGTVKDPVWLKDASTNEAFACTHSGKGTHTVSFDSDAGTSTCTFVADKNETSSEDDEKDSSSQSNENNSSSAPSSSEEDKATGTDVTVEVILEEGVAWDKVYIYAYNWDEATDVTTEYSAKWPGTEMTLKNGKWYATINTTESKVSYVITNGTEKSWDIKDVKTSNGKVSFTMSATKDSYGKYEASVTQVKTGDFSSVAMMVAMASLAATVVVAMKKKAVNQ